MENLIFASATSLANMIREKQVSSKEVVESYLHRIEEVNPKLNAVVVVTADRALTEAEAADSALAAGSIKGTLHGVPMTIKDALETAGVVSTGGTMGRASYVPSEDATVVARLRDAGGIMLGKTNLPELSAASESDNLIYGRTNNPYDLSRTPGGSSGGEAAIIAAGGSPFGIGSDSGGSIRHPSHLCGIAGIKPTSGRVPRTGHFPPPDGLTESWWQVGPMARYVEDLALILPIIAGVDSIDPGIAPVPLGDPDDVEVGSLRVSFHTAGGALKPTDETRAAVEAAAAALADAGCHVEEAAPPGIENIMDISWGLDGVDGGAAIRALLKKTGTTRLHPLMEQDLARQSDNAKTGVETAALLIRLDEFRRSMLTFMGKYDIILCPVHTSPAVPHGTGVDEEHFPGFMYAMAYNITGCPGAVVRGGTSPEGLPIGVQVVARPWREDMALAAALSIEATLGGWQPPPL